MLVPLAPVLARMSQAPRFSAGSSPRRTRRRPIGITLLTLYDGFFVGILPVAITLVHFFQIDPGARPPEVHILATLLMSAGLLWAANGTYHGRPGARIGLVVLSTMYYAGVLFGAPYTVDAAALLYSDGGAVETALRVGRSLFWIGLHGWYLLASEPARAFFELRSPSVSTEGSP